jgi:hypothetical protein
VPETDLLPVSLDDFKQQLTDSDIVDFGDQDNDELTRHLLAATGLIEDRIGPLVTRSFTEDHRRTRSERHYSGGKLLLRRRPAVAVTALSSIIYGVVTAGDRLRPAVHYLDTEAGIFDLQTVAFGWADYRVTYTAGRGVAADIPAKYKQAVLITAEHLWETQRGRGLHPSRFGSQADPTEVPEIMRGFALPRRALELIALDELVVFG